MNKKLRRFSVSISSELIDDFDEVIRKMGYERSKAIRLAMKNYLTEYRWSEQEEGRGVGAITMIYDHEAIGLEESLTEIQHEHRNVINSTTHVHLDEDNCLEIIVVKGEVKTIHSLAKKMMGEKGVKQLRLTTLIP